MNSLVCNRQNHKLLVASQRPGSRPRTLGARASEDVEMPPETVTYRRTDLYEEIWKDPVRTVAKRYGVSDVALGKICRKLNVPVPGLGYWARIRVGQTVSPPPLPPLPPGAPCEIAHERWHPRAERSAPANADPAGPLIIVPPELHSPHKLVSETSRVLRGVRLRNDRCLDVHVSKESRGRALRIMNTLVRELEKRRLEVEVTRSLTPEERQVMERGGEEVASNATRVKVDGEWIRFGISELRSVIRTPPPEPPPYLKGRERDDWIDRHPEGRDTDWNGKLELIIRSGEYLGARRTWHDGKKKGVENRLNDFIAHLHVMSGVLKRHREDLQRVRLEREEEERRHREAQRRAWEDEEANKRVEAKLRRWRLAKDAMTYAAEVRRLSSESGRVVEPGSPLEKSLAQLDAYVKRMDPLAVLREHCSTEPAVEEG
jgi:hypothetical protein